MNTSQNGDQTTYDEFVGYLRSALHYLYDPVHLRRSPLVALLGLANEFDKAAALLQVLTRTIHALKPAEDEPPLSPSWRIYDVLNLQNIHQFTRETVASQLGVSERQLRREQRLALEALSQRLWQGITHPLPKNLQALPGSGQLEQEKASPLTEELGWLKNTALEQRIPLGEILRTVYNLSLPLAEQQQVPLQLEVEEMLVESLMLPLSMRSILLTILSAVIPQAKNGRVLLSAFRHDSNIIFRVNCSTETNPASPLGIDDNSLETARRLAQFYGADVSLQRQDQDFAVLLTVFDPEGIPILVIDDNADWLDMLKRFAVGSHYEVIQTREPQTACLLAEKVRPAVIFLDVMMPVVDGWQILSELRSHQATHEIPIIVCTILPLQGLAMSLGVNAFIQKPITQDQFLAILEKMVIRADWHSSRDMSEK